MLFFRAAILLCPVRDAQYKTSESPKGKRRELGIINFRKDFWDLYWGLGKNGQYATSMFPTMHPFCPPKFCITFVFHFSWVLQLPQDKLKTMLVQNFGGQIINNYWMRLSKISWFVCGEHINYFPKPKFEANNWSARHWQITIFCDNRVQ